jgi:hypothetical protein
METKTTGGVHVVGKQLLKYVALSYKDALAIFPAAVVMPQLQTGAVLCEGADTFPNALRDRFERFETARLFQCMDADEFGRAVTGGGEDRYRIVNVAAASVPHIWFG